MKLGESAKQNLLSIHVTAIRFFGYKFLLPLWDIELADFFKELDFCYKNRNRQFSYILLRNLYDDINFEIFNQYYKDSKLSAYSR